MKESEVESYFVWSVEMNGGKTWKTKAIGQRGFPDRLACMPNGQMWLVELKTKGGRLTKLQQMFADDMADLNQRYACLWTKDHVDAWIESVTL